MKIKDALYRFIDVPSYCESFINQPEFQRLRRIKQLGLVDYVYPSATHTRFTHSLGVMHLAGMMADQLKVEPRLKKLLQIAGLMHDIGHVGLAHYGDSFMDTPHELRSVLTFININKRLQILNSDETLIVSNIITGNYPESEKHRKWLYSIISSRIDVDRMDYLQRDAYHLGLQQFQADYIINNAYITNGGKLDYHDKAKYDIIQMLEQRKYMYKVVYRHKTVEKIEEMLQDAVQAIIEENKDEWLIIDDYFVFVELKKNYGELMDQLERREIILSK